jgi:hypothetical protein
MLWIPIKKSEPVNLSRSLEVFILKNYDKPTHERLRPFFSSLDDSRRSFVESSDSSNLELVIQSLETYLSGLTLLESRIPISSTDLKFTWSDSYLRSKQPVLTFTLEKLCVMYNIAACWSKIASDTDLRSLNGHKTALSAFQSALNWLQLCKKLVNDSPVDQKGEICADNFELWAFVMTAQGYCTLFDKLDKQTAKKESIAKLAFSVYSNFEKALSFLANVKSFPKEQENILKFNSAFYEATGHYYQALFEKEKASNTGSGFGQVVARLKVTEKCLNKALTLRGIRGNLLENGKNMLTMVASEKNNAENENFTIYMERIPEESEVNVLEALNMIIPKEVVLREFPGKELILIIVPAEIIGIHKEFESFIMRQFEVSKEKVDLALEDVKKSFFGKTFEGIPEVTWLQISEFQSRDCEAEIEQIRKIKTQATEKLNQSLEELKKEELEDEELRKRFGPAWTRPTSASATQELKKEVELLLSKLAQASETDEKTVAEFQTHKASLDILALSRSDLDKLVPQVESSVLSEKESLSLQLQESESSLVNILNQYREAIFNTNSSEDLKRIVDQKLVKEEVFEEISLEFSDFRDKIAQEIEILKQKQEKFLQLLASVSVEYRAAEFLDNVARSLECKKNLALRLEQGIKFYLSFDGRVGLACAAIREFVMKRDEEKKNFVARMHHSAPVGNVPVSSQNINYSPAARPPSNILYQPGGTSAPNQGYPPQGFSNAGYPPQGHSSQTYSQQGYPPPQGYSTQGYPQGAPSHNAPSHSAPPQSAPSQNAPQGAPAKGYSPQGAPPQGYSPQGAPSQGYSPQGAPPQGYPPQGYSTQGYPPQGYPPQGYPPQGYPPQGYPPQGYPPQGYPPQAYPTHGYPSAPYQTQPYPGQPYPQGYPGNYPPQGYPPNPFQQVRK